MCVVVCIIVHMELMNMMMLTKPEAATTSNLIAIFGENFNIDHNRRAKKCRSCTMYCMQVCFLHMLMLYIEHTHLVQLITSTTYTNPKQNVMIKQLLVHHAC